MDTERCEGDSRPQNTGKVMMELAVAPPRRVATGLRLRTPLVVTFSGLSTSGGEDQQPNGQAFTLPDLSGIWVFLSLTTASMEENSITRRDDLFGGKRADSVHQLYREQHGDRPTIAYAAFPDLVITQAGSYRIKVAIIDMDAVFKADTLDDAPKVQRILHSQVFEVLEASEHSGCEPKLAETIGRLRSMGVNC